MGTSQKTCNRAQGTKNKLTIHMPGSVIPRAQTYLALKQWLIPQEFKLFIEPWRIVSKPVINLVQLSPGREPRTPLTLHSFQTAPAFGSCT